MIKFISRVVKTAEKIKNALLFCKYLPKYFAYKYSKTIKYGTNKYFLWMFGF